MYPTPDCSRLAPCVLVIARPSHPSTGKNPSPDAADQFRRVTDAFDVLGDPAARHWHDARQDEEAARRKRRRREQERNRAEREGEAAAGGAAAAGEGAAAGAQGEGQAGEGGAGDRPLAVRPVRVRGDDAGSRARGGRTRRIMCSSLVAK